MEERSFEQELVLGQVIKLRASHPRMGGRKLYELLEPFMLSHQIKMGRDALFDLLSANNLLVKRRKRRVCTTHSHHWLKKYPNLIRGLKLTSSHQLWVSDITYWKVGGKYLYLSLLTDAYSHKIVGYHLSNSLEAEASVKALNRALFGLLKGPERPIQLIHHSDRGIQYCSKVYVKQLQAHNIKISMTEKGDPLENAIAERVNGILKEEYLSHTLPRTLKEARKVLQNTIRKYNEERPHMSINNLTPSYVHDRNIKTKKLWKNYYSKPISGQSKIVNLLKD